MQAQRGGGGIAQTFSQPGTIWAWVVSTMLWQLYPQERLGTPCTEGLVGFCAALDGKEDLVRTWTRSPDLPARRQPLYRLPPAFYIPHEVYSILQVFPSFKF
jgi:hypothetical protein